MSTVTAPVQVIWGEEDQILPASHADDLPDNVTVTKYEKTGHMPHMERAADVNELIGKIAG